MAKNYLHHPDTPLLWLTSQDAWTINHAFMGTAIFGGTGSGRTLAHAFLRAGFGGLVLCAKPNEAALWRQYCHETGRENSLIVVNNNNGKCFNFLEYELARIDGGSSKTPFALEALLKIYEAMMAIDGVKADESFWRNSVRLLLSHSIDALYTAYGRLHFPDLMDFINSAARDDAEFNSLEWRKESFHYHTLEKAAKTPIKPADSHDFAAVLRYFRGFAELDKRTKSNIIATLEAMVLDFQKGDLRRVFCTNTNVVPELSHHGAIIVLDFPLKEWQRGGQIAQHIFKFAWQRAIERRTVNHDTRPCFLWSDEYQLFVSAYDAEFQSTARSSRACTVVMTQSIPALREAVRSTTPEENVDALLNNFQTTIIHACKDSKTQIWAADLLGKGEQYRYSTSQGTSNSYSDNSSWTNGSSYSHNSQGAGQASSSSGSNWGKNRSFGQTQGNNHSTSQQQVIDYHLQPTYFGSQLRMGGKEGGYCVDAVIVQTGRIWRHSGTSWLKCTFSQK